MDFKLQYNYGMILWASGKVIGSAIVIIRHGYKNPGDLGIKASCKHNESSEKLALVCLESSATTYKCDK